MGLSILVGNQKARDRYLGGKVPFGYRRGESGELVPHEGEREAIRERVALRAQGRPLRAIAEALRAKKGHRISHEGVAGVLRAQLLEGGRGQRPSEALAECRPPKPKFVEERSTALTKLAAAVRKPPTSATNTRAIPRAPSKTPCSFNETNVPTAPIWTPSSNLRVAEGGNGEFDGAGPQRASVIASGQRCGPRPECASLAPANRQGASNDGHL